MATVASDNPQFESALEMCVSALRRIADFKLDSTLERRMNDLGQRKEYLDEPQHDELLSLVAFAQQRNIEKLEAQVALQRLRQFLPEMVDRN